MKNHTKTSLDELNYQVIGAAIKVHKTLGPGLLESIYHRCLEIELEDRGISFVSEYRTELIYNGRTVDTVIRCDLFIENTLVVELKSVKEILPVHEAQLISYMKLLGAPKGLLFNFYCTNLAREGQRSFVSEHFRYLPD